MSQHISFKSPDVQGLSWKQVVVGCLLMIAMAIKQHRSGTSW